ncbi:uncharacterized protein C8A04DRAFT_15211 [Dichotomopilus funicola]|uniref:Zn(2)-C6 fungal-type domain-containing protein n=1 Tax=Dichotomopilus funicola TaxID=1934379 RepID=A0AAN6ZJR4_9PEZI|nr:hypothetical protein C8A04DRAFT_15211 [Dichotomopilus funicola]
MAAAHAAFVCFTCKARKKKCDKVLPSCGYCSGKRVHCTYASQLTPSTEIGPRTPSTTTDTDIGTGTGTSPAARHVSVLRSAPLAADVRFTLNTIPTEPSAAAVSLYLEANRLIRATGQFPDEIYTRYRLGIHTHLPVICLETFDNNLFTLATAPTPHFSVLLVAICLITYLPEAVPQPAGAGARSTIDRTTLHLAARSLFAQVRVSSPHSVHLIQAGLLLAVYEYARGHADDAFTSLGECTRMAYAAHIWRNISPPRPPNANLEDLPGHSASSYLDAEEATNTWWGLIICERANAPLPSEPEALAQAAQHGIPELGLKPNSTVSSLASDEVGGFGRAAQAALLLDQVLKSFQTPNLDDRLVQLDGLDTALRTFLTVVLEQSHGKPGPFCGAISLAIRALFTLHLHILDQPRQTVSAKFKSLDQWRGGSRAALDTIIKMVVDIADSHDHVPPERMDSLPPSFCYDVILALRHIHTKPQVDTWLREAEERLQTSLDRFDLRWGVGARQP